MGQMPAPSHAQTVLSLHPLIPSADRACTAVSIGEYSANGSTRKYSCTNKPRSNSRYTGRGGGSNACPFACTGSSYMGSRCSTPRITSCGTDRHLTSGSARACTSVSIGEYSANGSTSKIRCTNKPRAHSRYTGRGGGSNACAFVCTGGYTGSRCTTFPRIPSCGTDQYLASASARACTAVSIGEYSSNGSTSEHLVAPISLVPIHDTRGEEAEAMPAPSHAQAVTRDLIAPLLQDNQLWDRPVLGPCPC